MPFRTQLYRDYFIGHCKDPVFKQPGFNGKYPEGFFRGSLIYHLYCLLVCETCYLPIPPFMGTMQKQPVFKNFQLRELQRTDSGGGRRRNMSEFPMAWPSFHGTSIGAEFARSFDWVDFGLETGCKFWPFWCGKFLFKKTDDFVLENVGDIKKELLGSLISQNFL